jgi:hypothetical protein
VVAEDTIVRRLLLTAALLLSFGLLRSRQLHVRHFGSVFPLFCHIYFRSAIRAPNSDLKGS